MVHGLTGYAKNLNDGDVEVVVCGEEDQINQMAEWLNDGPRTATVDNVLRVDTEFKQYKGFEIL